MFVDQKYIARKQASLAAQEVLIPLRRLGRL